MRHASRENAITIAGRRIGPGEPPFVIAEMSGNHNGRLERALELVDAAKAAGVDALKLQTYTASTITIDHPGKAFRITGGPWDGRTLHDLYDEAHTPWDWHAPIMERARELGLVVFSSPFDPTAVTFLEQLEVPAYKIASFELVDLPLIRLVAATGKPVIMSTGLANLGEIEQAVAAARGAGCRDLALLHCVSAYPAPADDSNLLTIPHLAATFDVPVGLSDHTAGTAVSVAAVALGASIIEKHLTLRRSDGGPDASFSLEPQEFSRLSEDCRQAWVARGRVNYEPEGAERGNIQFRRSLYVVADIAEGEPLTAANIRSIRPGFGLPPRFSDEVLGRRARRHLSRGEPLSWFDIA